MLIYEKKNNEIIKLEKNEFESEKDLQNFVEKNMEKLFSIKFIKSEFQIDKYRFDSVGFNKDEDWNSFVIFEYKKKPKLFSNWSRLCIFKHCTWP